MTKSALATLFGRTVLIGAQERQTRDLLNHVFGTFRCNVIQSTDRESSLRMITDGQLVDIVIYETTPPLNDGIELLKKIPTANLERVPMFLIVQNEKHDLEEAFFHGADGVFSSPLHFDEVAKGVAFAYGHLIDSAQRQNRRSRIRRARASVSAAHHSLSGFVTNISGGGMFVTSTDALPAANQIVNFKVEYEGKRDGFGAIEVSGRGIVRWLRPFREYGRPSGFGIEFTDLDEGSSEMLRGLRDRDL